MKYLSKQRYSLIEDLPFLSEFLATDKVGQLVFRELYSERVWKVFDRLGGDLLSQGGSFDELSDDARINAALDSLNLLGRECVVGLPVEKHVYVAVHRVNIDLRLANVRKRLATGDPDTVIGDYSITKTTDRLV